MKLNKNKSISYIIITTLLSGCFNPFGVDMDSAKSDIAEEIYYNHLRSNYSVLSNGKITLHETLGLLSIMGKHTKEEKMQNYNSKVAAL
ncbi:hypothetical protein [Acinetobacter guillouiae]